MQVFLPTFRDDMQALLARYHDWAQAGPDFEIMDDRVRKFAEYSGDYNGMHLDREYARQYGFQECLMHGDSGIALLPILASSFQRELKELLMKHRKGVLARSGTYSYNHGIPVGSTVRTLIRIDVTHPNFKLRPTCATFEVSYRITCVGLKTRDDRPQQEGTRVLTVLSSKGNAGLNPEFVDQARNAHG